MIYADLEIALHRRDRGNYAVEFRFSPPGGEVDIRLIENGSTAIQFDLDRLRVLSLDSESYTGLLSKSFFNDAKVVTAFNSARDTSQAQDVPLRVRLSIDTNAPELHGLRWETLQDPATGASLFNGEQVLFSRYLNSMVWGTVHLRRQSQLSALVVIANPANLSQFQLAPVNVSAELERARVSIGNIGIEVLASGGTATLNNLCAQLRAGQHDILYLVCHGSVVGGIPWLWMEDEHGNVARVSGHDLVMRMKELQERPPLIVLASCESAGKGDGPSLAAGGVLAALGPRLAEAGVPAVVAMQGSVSVETVDKFMPTFFRELLRDGQIDRAMGVARGEVRQRPDYWMPILFMRLKKGCIWYVPGFAKDSKGYDWEAMIRSIRRGRCTPILGPGLVEPLLGTSREIAQRWAERYHFPMAPHDREDLPHVAQFLAVKSGRDFPRDELEDHLKGEIRARYAASVANEPKDASLDRLVEAIGSGRRRVDEGEPHRLLANMPFPIYLSTNVDRLLENALLEAGKTPQSEICRWNSDIEVLPSIYDSQPNYRADSNRPLVYHLFGRLSERDSIVLTEDDYFDYLIGVTSNKDLIPGAVRRALVDTCLLFLGFQMDDWNFRVLFRSIMRQEGGKKRVRYTHVAVQIDPEQSRTLEPEGARKYLEKYFGGADISIYWGRAEDFVKELMTCWTASKE